MQKFMSQNANNQSSFDESVTTIIELMKDSNSPL